MLKYFHKNSPKVCAPEDFVSCGTAMPLITTTCGFVNAVSCWTRWMSFDRREHSVLLTPFLRFPLVSEYGIEDRSSSVHLSGRLDEMRSLINKSLSALTVISLLLDLTSTLFALLNLGSWCLELAPRNPSRERKYKAVWYMKLKLLSGKLWVWVNEFISPNVNWQLLLI